MRRMAGIGLWAGLALVAGVASGQGAPGTGTGSGGFPWPDDWPVWGPRARLGVQVQPMTEELREHMGAPRDRGILVARVAPGSAAEKAGLRVGDVVLSSDGEPVREPHDLVFAVASAPAGSQLVLELLREGKKQRVTAAPEGEPAPGLDREAWRAMRERMSRGLEQGRKELLRRLEELEQRLRELEQRLDETAPREQEKT